MFWRQKANNRWIKEANHNTRFLHRSVQKRRQKLYIHPIKDINGTMIKEKVDFNVTAVSYFKFQLNGVHLSQGEEILQHIPELITEDDNKTLDQPPSMEEIHK